MAADALSRAPEYCISALELQQWGKENKALNLEEVGRGQHWRMQNTKNGREGWSRRGCLAVNFGLRGRIGCGSRWKGLVA